jgi:translation initiation factor eIF-2B subunit epsilon
VIPPGSVLSLGVVIADNTKLQENLRVSTIRTDGSPAPTDEKVLGKGAKGAPFTELGDEEPNETDPSTLQRGLIYSLANLNISDASLSTFASDDSDSDFDPRAGSLADPRSSRSRLSSFASDDSMNTRNAFHTDAVTGLLDALRDTSQDFDSAKLEFMGLRLANDASDVAMRKAVAVAFARRAAELVEEGMEPTKAAEVALTSRKGVTKFIDEVGVGGGTSEQVEFALALQKALVHARTLEPTKAGSLLAALFQRLYGVDVLEEEGILQWWADERTVQGESMGAVKERCRVLVEWLENAEEEEDDDDDDD